MARTWRCRVGWHKWTKRVNDAHESYLVCMRCGKHDDNEGFVGTLGWG